MLTDIAKDTIALLAPVLIIAAVYIRRKK